MGYNKEYAKKVYAGLTKRGYTADELGDETKFVERMADEDNRKYLYDQVQKRGDAKMGSWERFNSKMMEVAPVVEAEPQQGFLGKAYAQATRPVADVVKAVPQKGGEKAASEQAAVPNTSKSVVYEFMVPGMEYGKYATPVLEDIKFREKVNNAKVDEADVEAAMPRANRMMSARARKDASMKGAFDRSYATTKHNELYKSLEEQLSAVEGNLQKLEQEFIAKEDADRETESKLPKLERMGRMMSRSGMPGATANFDTFNGRLTDPEWRMLNTANRIIGESKELIDAAKNDRGMWTGIGRTLADIDTWTSLMEGLDAKAIADVADVDLEKATPAQLALLDALAMRVAVEQQYGGDVSSWYSAGETIGNMVPLAIEMGLNPAGGLGRKAAQAMLKKVATKGTKSLAKRIGQQAAIKGAGYLGSMAGGAAMSSTTSLPGIAVRAKMNSIGDAQYDVDQYGNVGFAGFKPGESYGKEFLKEFGRTTIEHATEQMGAEWLSKLIGKPLGWIGKGAMKIPGVESVTGKVGDLLDNKVGDALKKLAKDVNYQGPIEEFGEEFVSALHTASIDGMDSLKKWFEGDNLETTAIAVTMPALLGLGASVTYGAVDYKRGAKAKSKQMQAYKEGFEAFADMPEDWKTIVINLNSPSGIIDEMKRIYNDQIYTDKQKIAALMYGARTMAWMGTEGVKGVNTDENVRMLNEMLGARYREGYEQEPTAENAVKEANEYTNARNEVVEVMSLAEDADVDAMLEGRTAEEIAMGDTEIEDAVNNYIKARARRDGFRERYQEERDRQFAESDRSIDETANDGMVYTTTAPSGEKIIITGGKVVLDNEGYIDVNQSEGLVAMFPDSQKKPVRPGDLREKVEVSNAEETKAARRASIEERWRAEFESAENAYVEQQKRAEGVVFDITDKEGTHRVEVVKEGDEMSNILVDGEVVQISTEMLNALRGEAGVAQTQSGKVAQESTTSVSPVEENAPVVQSIEQPGLSNAEQLSNEKQAPTPIPVEKRGKEERAAYHLVPFERTMEDLHDGTLEPDEIVGLIDARIKEAESDVNAVEKKKPVIGADKNAYVAAKQQWQADMEAAKAKLDYYNQLKAINAEATRSEMREAVEAVEPQVLIEQTPDEFVANQLGGFIKITPESFQKETGLKAEQKQMVGVVAGKDKGGVTVEQAAEIILENYGDELRGLGFNGDMQDMRDMIINILSNGNPRSYAKKGAEMRAQESVEQQMSQLEGIAIGMNFKDTQEMIEYEEAVVPRIIQDYTGFDETEYFNNLAENIEYDTTRESEDTRRGSELLQGEQSADNAGAGNIAEPGQGGEVQGDVYSGGENAASQGNQQQVSSPEILSTGEVVSPVETNAEGGNAPGNGGVEENEEVGPFGRIYRQFKGKAKEAIQFLLGKKEGEAVGALSHPEIGDIDLVWGEEGTSNSDGYGIAKLAKYHPEVLDNLQEIINDMRVTKRSANRVQLESDTHQAAVRLTWDNKSKNWLLTAFEKKNSVSDNTTDTGETSDGGKQNDTTTLQNTVSTDEGTTQSAKVQEKTVKSEETAENGGEKMYSPEELAEAKEQLGELNATSAPEFAARLFSIKPWKTLEEANAALKELLASYGETLNGQSLAVMPFLDKAQGLIREYNKSQEPRSVEEVLENGDKRITNYNSRGEVATVATERDGKIVSVDSYDEGVLFEHTEYDTNGKAASVTRYDKQGNAIGTQVYVDGKAVSSGKVKAESGKPKVKSGTHPVADEVLAMAKKKQQARFADHAKGIAEKLGVEVTVHNDESTVTNKDALKAITEGGEVKGWYNPTTGEIALFMPNMESMRDVESTILHEAVSHYGIKHFLGKEDFNKFLDGVWDMMPAGARAFYLDYVGADMKNPSTEKMRQAADEYVAHIAEKMDLNELERSVWQRFIDYVMDVLRKAGFKNLKQRDVEAVIRASYANLRKNGNVKTENGKVSQVTGQGETMASKKMSERRQEKNRINNVLDEVGGIIYGNKEYAKKQRLKREAERKELAKEIYSSVLKGDFNDVTLSQIDKFIEDATPANPFGRRISQRLPQRMERALRQGARANAVDALFSRISESAVPANERFSEAGRREIEERKKELLKGWAIATGNWHTDLKEFTDDTEPIGEGKDSKVYSSKDGRYVIKASKGKPFGKRFRPDIDNIALFNDVFRDTRYEILGYGEIDGEFVRILQQPIVDFAESTPLTSEERREYMQSLGFEPLNDANTAFADGEIVIADLQKGNVVRDAAGNISVIDADAKLHTKDVGGDYTYPPVESDLPEGTDLGGTMFRKVTPEMDAEYMAAVENGDMETAERLVKEAAKLAMPDTKVVDEDGYPMPMFHGDRKKGRYKFSTDTFFTPNEQYAKRYTGGTGEVYPVYLNIEKPFDVRDNEAREIFTEFNSGNAPVETTTGALDWGQYTYEDLQEYIEENYPGEYDGFILDEGGEPDYNGNVVHRGLSYIPFTSNQAKYSSSVTYDDNGNVIPLSERFNEEKEDIRFRRVFHGSGAQFDRFDHSFMGTGEGAQAYGWGTYVSEDRGVGKSYADTIGGYEFTGKKRGNVIRRLFDRYTGRQRADENTVEVAKRLLNEHGGYDAVLKEYAGLMPGGSLGKAVELIRNSDRLDWKGRHYLYTVEIPDDDGTNYLHWDRPVADEVVDGMKDALLNERGEDIAGYAALEHGMSVEEIYGRLEYALGSDKAASEFLSGLGYVGISYPAWADGARNYVIFNEDDAQIEDRTMFRRANKNQEVFVSNAQRAVEGIKQEKATPEQWIAMLKKNGGLKAGEEAWLGLEEWLTEKGKVKGENGKPNVITKQEILDFIGENKIQIEEVEYESNPQSFEDLKEEYEAMLRDEGYDAAHDAMVDRFGDDFDIAFEDLGGELAIANEEAAATLLGSGNIINSTRLDYTTEGLKNKREIALVVPTIEPYNQSDEIHFGDAGEGRAVAWVRFGETTDSEGNRVLVIDEIQSKRHQDGREKGYRGVGLAKEVLAAEEEVRKTNRELTAYREPLKEKYNFKELGGSMFERLKNFDAMLSEEERITMDALGQARNEAEKRLQELRGQERGIPSAPFEKNWQELAMKRMLRLAAEEGFDKVAWTTGEQQAERYNIGAVVNRIESNDTVDYDSTLGVDLVKQVVLFTRDGNAITLRLTPEGIVRASSQYNGHHISDIVGKELGNRIMTETDLVLKEQDLRIGGEGMKGFYDKMLPSFVQKYTKKWGAKVGEVTMPNLSENNTMHSVDVTQEMKESVMEGQTMFSKKITYDEAVQIGNDFANTHKGATKKMVFSKGAAEVEQQMRDAGFTELSIEVVLEDYKSGDLPDAVYLRSSDGIVLYKYPTDTEVYASLWHENGHRAMRMIYGDDLSEVERVFNTLPEDIRNEKIEELEERGYTKEEFPKETVCYFIQDAYTIGALDNAKVDLTDFGKAYPDMKDFANFVQQIINYTRHGEGNEDFVSKAEGEFSQGKINTRLQERDARGREEGTGTSETATGGLTEEVNSQEGETLFRKNVTEEEVIEQQEENEESIAKDAVMQLGEALNAPVTIIEDLNSLPDNRRNKKGWFDPKTGEVVVVIPNHVSSEDAVQTVLHEVVGHRGLRAVLGEKFDEFLDDVFKNASPEVKRGISDKFFGALRKGHALTVREATEEYIAELAERGFEGYNGVWNSIKQWLKDAFRSLVGFEVTDNELRYLLWKSYNRQKSGPIETILDIAMEAKTGTGNTMFRVVEDYNKGVQGVRNKAKEGWYDEMRSIKVAQEAIEKELGREVLDSENVYLYANHLPSINKNKKEVFDNKYLKPFTSLLKKLYELEVNGQKMDEKSVERYTNAKHGIERNREMSVKKALTEVQDGEKVFNEEAYAAWAQERDAVRKRKLPWAEEQRELDKVAKKYGAKIRDYSGLTAIFDVEGKMKYAQIADAAYKYVEDVEGAGGENVKELWKLIKGMTDYSLKEAYESGMMSKSTYEHIKQMYRYYVPLRGFTEQTAEDFFDYVEGDHSPLNAVVKTAKGRTSEAENIFATILNMANSAIVQGSKNRLKQRLLNLAMRSRTGLLSVDNAWYAKVGDEYIPVEYPEKADEYAAFEERMKELEENGEVVRHRPGLEIGRKVADKWNQQQHAVRVKRNGREYVVWVNGDPRLANAVNGMLRENFDETWIGALNRWRAQMVTQYSPTFIFTNLVRDVQEASMTYAVRRGTKMMGNFDLNVAVNSVKMMSLYLKHKKGTLNEEIPVERYFKEFLENGGETGYTEMISIEQYEKKLKKLTEGLNIKNATGRAFEAVGEGVEFANRCIENLCRFSAYQTSREAGMSILKSIEDAKEVSVNFNRKGSGAMGQKWAKAFYMFLNPAIQSLAKRILLTKKFPKKMAAVWAGEFVMGATAPLLWSLIWSMFGDDEDKDELMGNYFNLTDYRRRSGLCLPGKDGVFHIPLSHEARALYGLGELFTSYVMGHEEYDNVPVQIFNTLSQSLPLNPLDGWAPGENILESMAYNLTPDAAKPIAEVIMNRDFAGNKVHNRSDFNEFLPEYMRGKRGTADIYKSISKVLSGKEIYGKGVLDNLVGTLVNPSTMEHLVEGYLGGAYSFADKAVKTGKWILGNEEYAEFKNVPIGSSFYTSLTKYEDKPREERTRRDWEDAFKFYQQEVKYYDDKETAAKNGEKNGEESGTLVLEQMERNGEVLMVDIFNDGNDRLKELYGASDVARRNREFDKAQKIDKQIYAEKKDIVERMEKLADDPMIGYTFKRNKIKGVYGELETYGDVRDANIINDFQTELKPIYEGLEKAEDRTAYANEHQKELGLYKTLDEIERGVGNYKSAMKKIGEEYPDYAQDFMTNIRTLRAGAVELINKYRNE